MILGDEEIHAVGERMMRHLKRRGYRIVYDPGMDRDTEEFLNNDATVEVPRLAAKEIPESAVLGAKPAVTLEINGRDVRCLTCSCFTFYVHDGKATCTGCKATYRVKE